MSDAPQLADVSGMFPEFFSRAFEECCGFVLRLELELELERGPRSSLALGGHVVTPSAAGSGLIATPQSARG